MMGLRSAQAGRSSPGYQPNGESDEDDSIYVPISDMAAAEAVDMEALVPSAVARSVLVLDSSGERSHTMNEERLSMVATDVMPDAAAITVTNHALALIGQCARDIMSRLSLQDQDVFELGSNDSAHGDNSYARGGTVDYPYPISPLNPYARDHPNSHAGAPPFSDAMADQRGKLP